MGRLLYRVLEHKFESVRLLLKDKLHFYGERSGGYSHHKCSQSSYWLLGLSAHLTDLVKPVGLYIRSDRNFGKKSDMID